MKAKKMKIERLEKKAVLFNQYYFPQPQGVLSQTHFGQKHVKAKLNKMGISCFNLKHSVLVS